VARIQSSRFQLAIGVAECWSCHQPTRAGAPVAPSGSIAVDDEFELPESEEVYEPVVLANVVRVSDDIAALLRFEVPTFRIDASNTLHTEYWMNHCQHCDAKQGDFFLHASPDGPFFAWPRGDATTTLIDLCGGEIQCDMPYLAPEPTPRKAKRSMQR
jgi:hypothetical protein